jgi:hypothetical protein
VPLFRAFCRGNPGGNVCYSLAGISGNVEGLAVKWLEVVERKGEVWKG